MISQPAEQLRKQLLRFSLCLYLLCPHVQGLGFSQIFTVCVPQGVQMDCLLRCSSYFFLLSQQTTALPITNKYDVTLPSLSDSVMSFCCHFRVSFIPFRATLAPILTPQNQYRHSGTNPSPRFTKSSAPIAENRRPFVSQPPACESIK